MKTLLLIILLGSSLAQANTNELIAKCSFDLEITPGMPFVYVYKTDSGYGVIESIAHTNDSIEIKSESLKADHQLQEAVLDSSLKWNKVSSWGIEEHTESSVALMTGDNLWVTTGTPFSTIGSFAFTSYVYPTCVQWKAL